MREPQVKAAEAAVAAARSALRQPRSPANAVIKAPFNALVLSESADVGQLVGPGTPWRGWWAPTTSGWRCWCPARPALIGLPAGEQPGADATVLVQVGDHTVERAGRVVRRLGDLDPQSRMARVIVEVADPGPEERRSAAPAAQLCAGAHPGADPRGPVRPAPQRRARGRAGLVWSTPKTALKSERLWRSAGPGTAS
ncbi:MAG: hypothetical protein R3F43_06670 [bacterium]